MNLRATPAVKRKIAAILAADVAGYSRLVAEDEEETLRRLASYRSVIDDLIACAGGRIFNTAGDAVLAEFQSAVDAVRCAVDIQESLRARNAAYPASRQMVLRIGITIGDIVERDGDLLGDGVNIAARLQGLAPAGGICVSRAVHEAVANKVSIRFSDRGPQQLKNIPQPVHAYMLVPDDRAAQHRGIPWLTPGKSGHWPWVALAALLLAASGAGYVYFTTELSEAPAGVAGSPMDTPSPSAAPPDAHTERTASSPAKPPARSESASSSATDRAAANAEPSGQPSGTKMEPAPAPTTPASGQTSEPVIVSGGNAGSKPSATQPEPSSQASGAPPLEQGTSPSRPSSTDQAATDAALRRHWRDCKLEENPSSYEDIATACRALSEGRHASGEELARIEYTLGRALRELGNADEAVAAYTRAVALKPTADYYNHRGISFYDKNELENAIADYTEAINLDSQHGEAFNNRAWTRFKASKTQAALADADKAVQLLPNTAYVWDTRGHIHEALRNRTAAIRDFRKAISLDPNSTDSKAGLDRLGAKP